MEKVKIRTIKPAPWNPRTANRRGLGLLEKSFDKFGNLQPIVINKRTNTLLAGHQRLKILKRKKIAETEAWVVDQKIEDEKVIAIALNNHAGEFDMVGLGAILADLQSMTDDLDCTLFQEEEIDTMVARTLSEGVDTSSQVDDNINSNEEDIENDEPASETPPSTNISVSNESFKYDLYFENATDKLKFNAFIKTLQNKSKDVTLNGDSLLIAFDIP